MSTGASLRDNALKRRLLSAGVGIPVVLLAILAGFWGIAALVVAATAVAAIELSRMAGLAAAREAVTGLTLRSTSLLILIPVAAAATGAVGWFGNGDAVLPPLTWAAIAAAIPASAILVRLLAPAEDSGRRLTLILGIFGLYAALTMASAIPLSLVDNGRAWVMAAVLSTFAVDTGAFFTGLAVGRHRLMPSVSPKKTWEGAAGGLLAGMAAFWALNHISGLGMVDGLALGLGAAIAVTGAIGDLVESWVKRRASVKDAGSLIPGHGGILDRIDSLAPNFAVVYLAAAWSAS